METTKSVKIKIEFSDDSGTKYSFNIEGSSKDNINKLIDFAQTISTKQTSLSDHGLSLLFISRQFVYPTRSMPCSSEEASMG